MIRLLVLITVGATNTLLAADVSGNWATTMEANGRPVPFYSTLNRNVYRPSYSLSKIRIDSRRAAI
jgi:hypothetical protein